MKYQLVLQFEADGMPDFDRLIALETALIHRFDEVATVDGHDFGCGEFNIFVLTDDPETTFSRAHEITLQERVLNDSRCAYRRTDGEDYVILWPPSLKEFSVS